MPNLIRRRGLLFFVSLIPFLTTCAGGGSGMTCDASYVNSECIYYQASLDTAQCNAISGTTSSAGGCQTSGDGYIGSCTVGLNVHYFYSTGTSISYDDTSANAKCDELGGTYFSGEASGGGGGGGGGGSDVVHGSCSNMSGAPDQCIEFTDGGGTWTSSLMQSNCSTLSGSYSTGGCSSTNRVGRCRVGDGTPSETLRSYYSPTYDATSAEGGCTLAGGTWVAG